ncbi:MAG: sugar phosphate isomerase/epimerase family protein [Thermogutta sp.]
MRFAICNETFNDRSVEAGFELAAECGYEGIEIAPFTLAAYVTELTPQRRTEIRRSIEKCGLTTVGLHWLLAKTEGFHLTSPDPAVRARTLEYLKALAECCADLGGRILVFGSPQQRNVLPETNRLQAEAFAIEVLEGLLPTLERTGTIVALEPLGPQETNFVNTAEEAVAIIKKLSSPHIQLHLDCKAMASEAIPIPELIRTNKQYLVHFHANDPNRLGPGFGELDFVPIFKALLDAGYQGWVSVEVFDYQPGCERIARESIAYMQRCLTEAQKR